MAKSIMQTDKECYLTGSTENLHRHHIFYGSNRQNAERFGCWCWLRADWHNMADYGVHFNRTLDNQLKMECQEAFEKKFGHERFMEVFGKDYL